MRSTPAAAACPAIAPRFELKPERLFDKLAVALGAQDIDFGENPRFSKSYLLRGKDESAVRALFKPAVLRHLESRPGWSVEGGGGWFVLYQLDHCVEPPDLAGFIDEARRLAAVFRAG